MGKPFLDIQYDLNSNSKPYKSVLNKLSTFIRYIATVGIHSNDGKKNMTRTYMYHFDKMKAGKSHKMTLVKVAYQNEFGAKIPIKPRYKDTKIEVGKPRKWQNKYETKIKRNYEIRSMLRSAKEQGFLLISKVNGNFVMYKKPGDFINIPKRPFIRKVLTDPSPTMQSKINMVLSQTFVRGGLRAKQSFKQIAQIVTEEMKNNVRSGMPNHSVTVKNKGFDSPLRDEQDRIYNAIKYKIYKDTATNADSKLKYKIQTNIHYVDKLFKKSADYIDKGLIKAFSQTYSVRYKGGINPNWTGRNRRMSMRDFYYKN